MTANDFENSISEFLRLIPDFRPENGPVIIGLSGGADSVALLCAMRSLGYRCVAAHCNFHLRGEESDRDMEHSRATAKKTGAEFECVHFDVGARIANGHESVEMACRSLRYEWFGSLIEKYGAIGLLTGHHREDNIETLFLNLLRGCGINGASGIKAIGEKRISPLLRLSKQDILNYLSDKGLDYVTDSSNLESEYSRNKIRNEVIPLLSQLFPGARESLGKSLVYLEEDRLLLETAVNRWRDMYVCENGNIRLKELVANEKLSSAILFKLLSPFGFSRLQSDGIIKSNEASGKRFPSDTHIAVITRGILEIIPKEAEESIPHLNFRIISRDSFTGKKDFSEAYFDGDLINGEMDWEVRRWREGDRMCPLGMNGKQKKLSDIFNDKKTDYTTRRSPIVVTCNGEIVWVIGVKNSDRFKITPSTRRVLAVSLKF